MNETASDILQKKILESIPFGFIQVDLSGQIIYANTSAFELLEFTEDTLLGSFYFDIGWEQINETFETLKEEDHTFFQALQGKTVTSITRGLKRDQRLKWFSVSATPFYDENGKIVGAISNFVDITDKKELEEAKRIADSKIKEGQERYKSLISEAPYAITIYNKEGLLITANSKCEEYWRLPIKEYVGKFNIFDNDLFGYDKATERIKHAFNGESGEVTTKIVLTHSNNVERDFRIKYYPLFDSNGELDNVVYITEDITNYLLAEEKTKAEETLKQGILDALGDAILVIDNNGNILNINKSLSKYLIKQSYKGLKIGASIYDFIDRFDESDFLRDAIKSILAQEAKFFDHEMRLVDGKWYTLRITPLIEQFGAVISWQNINTRKEIEIALEKSLRKYRNIYNKAPVMMHSINRKLEIISVSDFWLEKMGYDRNEVIGRSPMDFIAGSYRDSIKSNLKLLFETGEVRNAEYQYVMKSGEIMEVLLSAVAEYDEDGKFERSIAGMIDITDQKIAERELQESQTRLLESQRISKIGNYEYDAATGDFEASSEMAMMMGLDKHQGNVSIINDLVHPEDLPEFKRKLVSAVSTGNDFFHIYRIYHLVTKKIKWISGRGRMIKDEKGKVIKMIGTVQDITEQRSAEDKIRKLTDRVLLATEIASLGVWEYDRDKDEVFWEDQMYNIFTNFKTPARVEEVLELLVDEDQNLIEENVNLIKSGVNFLEGEVRIMIGETIKYLRSFIRVMRHENGKYKGMVGVIYDITKDKKLQIELEASLDEKNILIKEVHHRVKNNMQLISSIMALKSYDLKDENSKLIFEEVNNRIRAMSVIHDKLYTFYNVSEIDLNEYLINIAQELQVLLSTSAIVIDVDADEVIVNVEKALLIGLVVSELVANAIKHNLDGADEGNIKIIFTEEEEGSSLSVLNNGNEVPEDALENTTGLGISLIKTFAKQLHGMVKVDERNGFRIDF